MAGRIMTHEVFAFIYDEVDRKNYERRYGIPCKCTFDLMHQRQFALTNENGMWKFNHEPELQPDQRTTQVHFMVTFQYTGNLSFALQRQPPYSILYRKMHEVVCIFDEEEKLIGWKCEFPDGSNERPLCTDLAKVPFCIYLLDDGLQRHNLHRLHLSKVNLLHDAGRGVWYQRPTRTEDERAKLIAKKTAIAFVTYSLIQVHPLVCSTAPGSALFCDQEATLYFKPDDLNHPVDWECEFPDGSQKLAA